MTQIKYMQMITPLIPRKKTNTPGETVAKAAETAFPEFKLLTPDNRILFFQTLIDELDSLKTEILITAGLETHLPASRLENEYSRTLNQIRLFIEVIRDGQWLEPSIDLKTDRTGHVITDIRKINVPLGPVVVFAASNFPLAFSVAGTDTISAFAVGCPVILKAHNGHPKTSKKVAEAIVSAGKKCLLPKGFFSILFDEGYSTGIELVKHPAIKAVAFTGSLSGGTALHYEINQRAEPIPFYAEMGSLNPVVLLPGELHSNPEKWAKLFASSITQGCGQFCTKPGLFFALESEDLDLFITYLKKEMDTIFLHPMLNDQILKNFTRKFDVQTARAIDIEHYISMTPPHSNPVSSSLGIISSLAFRSNKVFREEFFGPFTCIVKCKDLPDLKNSLSVLSGQLTATLVGQESELRDYRDLIELLKDRTGRILFNGVPTGVEVCHSMHHGGPFPASSSPQFTAVGSDAVKRFVRPLCFQSWPQALLPEELRNENPNHLLRRVNGKHTPDPITT